MKGKAWMGERREDLAMGERVEVENMRGGRDGGTAGQGGSFLRT